MNQTIRRSNYRKRASKRRRQRFLHRLPLILMILLLLVLLSVFCWMLGRHFLGKDSPPPLHHDSSPATSVDTGEPPTEILISTEEETTPDASVDVLLADAEV